VSTVSMSCLSGLLTVGFTGIRIRSNRKVSSKTVRIP
jgi:hypothetical protein